MDCRPRGPFQTETAHALFDKLITEDGWNKARNLGVPGIAGSRVFQRTFR